MQVDVTKLPDLSGEDMNRIKQTIQESHSNLDFVPNPGVMVLPEIPYDYNHVFAACLERLRAAKAAKEKVRDVLIVLPVRERQDTKKNAARIHPNDRTCPLGQIDRHDQYALERYYPYAPARFNCLELSKWLAGKIADIEAKAIAEAANNMVDDGTASD